MPDYWKDAQLVFRVAILIISLSLLMISIIVYILATMSGSHLAQGVCEAAILAFSIATIVISTLTFQKYNEIKELYRLIESKREHTESQLSA